MKERFQRILDHIIVDIIARCISYGVAGVIVWILVFRGEGHVTVPPLVAQGTGTVVGVTGDGLRVVWCILIFAFAIALVLYASKKRDWPFKWLWELRKK